MLIIFLYFLSACSGYLEEENDRTTEGDIGRTCAKRSDKVSNFICKRMIQNVYTCNFKTIILQIVRPVQVELTIHSPSKSH